MDLKVGNTLADQAYMKIANEFSLLSTDDATEKVRSNPFDTPNSSSGPKPTLEGLKTSKPVSELIVNKFFFHSIQNRIIQFHQLTL